MYMLERKMYMLEKKEPKPIRAIGNTCTYGDISYTWKQVAMSEDLEALKAIMRKDQRIINWDTLEVVCQNCDFSATTFWQK